MAKDFKLPPTLSETIYQHLKRAIIEGEYKPRQRLQEKEIARQFHISSTPVREAFLRLAAEKYLIISARREVLVSGRSLDEVRDLYEIVRVLDLYAARKFLQAASEKDLRKLEGMTDKLGVHYRKKSLHSYLQQNLKIHDKIWEGCGNAHLYETLVELMENIEIFRMQADFSPFSDPAALEKSYRDHLDLVEVVRNRDIQGLEKLISTHWGEEFIVRKKKAVAT